jgi:hypothetical protein
MKDRFILILLPAFMARTWKWIYGREIPQRKKDNRTDRNSGRMRKLFYCGISLTYIHFYGQGQAAWPH